MGRMSLLAQRIFWFDEVKQQSKGVLCFGESWALGEEVQLSLFDDVDYNADNVYLVDGHYSK